MSGSVLITGADGYIGSLLVKNYLAKSDKELMLWVRAANRKEFQLKEADIEKTYHPHLNRIQLYCGDLSEDNPFSDIKTENLKAIIHTAAITRFNVEEELANRINRDGVRKIRNGQYHI